MKFNSANSSFKLFCKGGSVINSRPRELKERTICEKNGIDVLDTVRFVNDDIFEAKFLEG